MMVDVSIDQHGDKLALVGICTYYVPRIQSGRIQLVLAVLR